MNMENTSRLERVIKAIDQSDIDTLLLMPSTGLNYVLGQGPMVDERLFILAISGQKPPFILANRLYKTEVTQIFAGDMLFWDDGEDPYAILNQELLRRAYPLKRIAVDQSTQARFLFPLMVLFPNSQFCPANGVLDALRVYKDARECDYLREACRLGDQALHRVMENGSKWIGRTEGEFFAQLSYEMTALGLENPGACICAGAHAADPHYTGKQGRIQQGDCLLVDFGGTYQGYYTDMTRTFWFGKPDPEFVRIHQIVCQANAAAKEAAVLGTPMQEVDRAARRVIEQSGYGPYFIHRTGHGVGMDVHEAPNAAAGEMAPLCPGMAFSIEPGIYLPGRFGVRIEDLVLMTESGVEVLHQYPRELICYP